MNFSKRLTTLLCVCCLIVFASPARTGAEEPAGPPTAPLTNPNIVVIYMDDVSPHDGRLWSDPTLTPTLFDRFVAHGVEFKNSIGETPLCCPGRAGFLTGLHTHNHGVVGNHARLFRPEMHVGAALKRAGYSTMFLGKYFNEDNKLTEAEWTMHGAGWTHLDAIKGQNGKFFDYTVHTKTGDVAYTDLHSTQMVGERAVMRFRETPPTDPIFAVLSVFNLHAPNDPMAQFKYDSRCDAMQPWKPPNFNEADVSDKPPYVQNQPLLDESYSAGWPMAGFCREMLGVDWLAATVVDELRAEGRLDNTLLVMTADNGMTWGMHRLGQKKLTPYSTPVPLFMSWPAMWGDKPHTVTENVSNIDLAPTFCALAEGCVMGPYPTGQQHPDGISLLPVIDDPAHGTLGRDAVLESAFTEDRTWFGLRTSPNNPLGHWHYVEWRDGFRELYNLDDDPFEMENLAARPEFAYVRSQLSTRLGQLSKEGRVGPPYRPDGAIAFVVSGPYKGLDFYGSVAQRQQTRKRTGVLPNGIYDYPVRLINRGREQDTLRVTGTASGTDQMTVSYFAGGVDVTGLVMAGTYSAGLSPLGTATLIVRITVAPEAVLGATKTAIVRVVSAGDPAVVDVVRAIAVY